jgi:hypothetical protein
MGTSDDFEYCYCCDAALPSAGGSCLICATHRGASIVLTSYLVFEQSCRVGLEGIVSKRLSKSYQSGLSRHWLKVKNPDSPAMIRARDHFARLGS